MLFIMASPRVLVESDYDLKRVNLDLKYERLKSYGLMQCLVHQVYVLMKLENELGCQEQ